MKPAGLYNLQIVKITGIETNRDRDNPVVDLKIKTIRESLAEHTDGYWKFTDNLYPKDDDLNIVLELLATVNVNDIVLALTKKVRYHYVLETKCPPIIIPDVKRLIDFGIDKINEVNRKKFSIVREEWIQKEHAYNQIVNQVNHYNNIQQFKQHCVKAINSAHDAFGY